MHLTTSLIKLYSQSESPEGSSIRHNAVTQETVSNLRMSQVFVAQNEEEQEEEEEDTALLPPDCGPRPGPIDLGSVSSDVSGCQKL